MLDGQVAMLTNYATNDLLGGVLTRTRLCNALERPDLRTDPRFLTEQDRFAHKGALQDELEATFLTHPAAEWFTRLAERGVPAAPINTIDRVMADPQVRHRGMLVDLAYDGTPITVLGNPVKLRGFEQTYTDPPRLGTHTRSTLMDLLGLAEADLADLLREGVLSRAHGPDAPHAPLMVK